MNIHIRASVALFVALLTCQPCFAALVTLTGSNFDIQFDNAQASLGLFGTPSLANGNILFSGNNFLAQSANGQGANFSGADFTLFLVPHLGMQISGLSVFAFGDYRLQGENSYVRVTGSLTADDSSSSDPLRSASSNLNVTTPGAINGVIGAPQNNQNSNWQASAGISSNGNPWMQTTGRVEVTISSLLTAYTDPANPGPQPGFAFIQEKLFVQQPAVTLSVSADPMVVPLPATLPLLLGGMAIMGWTGGRKRGHGDQSYRVIANH